MIGVVFVMGSRDGDKWVVQQDDGAVGTRVDVPFVPRLGEHVYIPELVNGWVAQVDWRVIDGVMDARVILAPNG